MALARFWHEGNTHFNVPYALVLDKVGCPLYVRYCRGDLSDAWAGARVSYYDKSLDSDEVKNDFSQGLITSRLPVISWDNTVISEGNVVLCRKETRALVINAHGVIYDCECFSGRYWYDRRKLDMSVGDTKVHLDKSDEINSQIAENAMYTGIVLEKSRAYGLRCSFQSEIVIVPDTLYHLRGIIEHEVKSVALSTEMTYCFLNADNGQLKEILMPSISRGTTYAGFDTLQLECFECTVSLSQATSIWMKHMSRLRKIKVELNDLPYYPTQFENILHLEDCPNLTEVLFPIDADGYNYIFVENCPKLNTVNLIALGGMPNKYTLNIISDLDTRKFILTAAK